MIAGVSQVKTTPVANDSDGKWETFLLVMIISTFIHILDTI